MDNQEVKIGDKERLSSYRNITLIYALKIPIGLTIASKKFGIPSREDAYPFIMVKVIEFMMTFLEIVF
ncbi:hypothetical protein RintRC_2522 [Richelia intracellularis]|nr:hypothetical protein RintRC_2522 [Richelia intracellularis]